MDGNRKKDNTEWVYGIRPVLEALRAGREIKALYVLPGRHDNIAPLIKESELKGIPVRTADRGFFDSAFSKGHQGVAAKVIRKDYLDLEDMLAIPHGINEPPFFVIIDCIEDPRNLGAILRSADAAGVHGAVLQYYRSAGIGPEVSKSSAGAAEYVPLTIVPNIKHAIRKMRDNGITVICAEAVADATVWDTDLTVPLAFVIGSEGRGVRKTVRENCDLAVSLPMRGRINSLNASVAAGILFYEVLRQRLQR